MKNPNDHLLTKENLAPFRYYPKSGKIVKHKTGKVMLSGTGANSKRINVGGKSMLQSRVAFFLMGEQLTQSQSVEFINGDKSDIRWDNMRVMVYRLRPKPKSSHKFKAVNDKYLPALAEIYTYNRETGDILTSSRKCLKPSDGKGYVGIANDVTDNKRVLGHRLAMYLLGNRDFDHLEVDHINGDRSDNRAVNLQFVTRLENRRNSAMQRNNTSGVAGVCFHKALNKWHARYRTIHIGYTDNLFDACCLRFSAEKREGLMTSRHGR